MGVALWGQTDKSGALAPALAFAAAQASGAVAGSPAADFNQLKNPGIITSPCRASASEASCANSAPRNPKLPLNVDRSLKTCTRSKLVTSFPSTCTRWSPFEIGLSKCFCTCARTSRTTGGDVHASSMPPHQSCPVLHSRSLLGPSRKAFTADERRSKRNPLCRNCNSPLNVDKSCRTSARLRLVVSVPSTFTSSSPSSTRHGKCSCTWSCTLRTTGGFVHASRTPPHQSWPKPDSKSSPGPLRKAFAAEERNNASNSVLSRRPN
mmetsp:Transcript_90097/g.209605  ORF Transcript_90097/g.209605 Transcript_90097/m.209605 type:complete len:265 (+) Transcript_90097:443-1237(+)